jgi:hypothetical protein
MSNLLWPTDEQFALIEGAIPMNRPGVTRRKREVNSWDHSGPENRLPLGGLPA